MVQHGFYFEGRNLLPKSAPLELSTNRIDLQVFEPELNMGTSFIYRGQEELRKQLVSDE
jgi:hypothetical protein